MLILYVILSIVEESSKNYLSLFGIRERTISVGKGGLFNHVGNNTLIRSINRPNIKEISKTKMLLGYIF